ncbi:MAG: alpha/beta fold hydrolase, partial [Planctomycetaceae bacterium]|nr:alpha/beta fold hydrolase [Planctomycetaceae bacterium]
MRRSLTLSVIVSLILSPSLPAQDFSTKVEAPKIPHDRLMVYEDESGAIQPVRTPEDWQHRRESILKGMQEAMGPFPDRNPEAPLEIKKEEEFSGDGFDRDMITFASGDGDRISADLYFPNPRPEGKVPAIVALHPTGAPGKRIVAGEGKANRQYAMELAKRGYVVIAPDYPSFGDLKDYNFENDDYISGTMKGIVNHMRCVDLLQSLPAVDPDRIGVIGHSLGGHNAIFHGVFDPRVKVIVSSCGWTPFHDYYGGQIKGWTSDRYMPLLNTKYQLNPDLVPFDFYELIAALAPRPFFSNSPISDSNFDVNGVKKAIPKAKEVYELFGAADSLQVVYPPCEHDFPTEIRMQAYRFIDDALGFTPRASVDFSGELPRISSFEPGEALQHFSTAPGFQVQQTAAEPLVTDPVAMSFDADGNLYVVEMKDYSEQETESLGQIRVLRDTDQDGTFDESNVFVDGLSWPTAIICYDGGIFVGAPPLVYYFKDTDGDFVSDESRVVFQGFGRSNVQGLMNCFRWGLDNRIHGATSSSGGAVTRAEDSDGQTPVELRGRDFSFDPRMLDLRPESGGAQHGMCFDDWGRKFVCSNSDHAQFVVFDDRYFARNPQLPAPSSRVSIADDGGQAPVYRTSQVEPWRIVRTRLRVSGAVRGPVEGGGRAAGYFTGATGITIYRGDAFPTESKGMAIVGDVGSN